MKTSTRPRVTRSQLVQENNEQANIERCVRELMAKLERPVAGAHFRSPASITSERSGSEAADDDVVYPVWFGTNRKPNAPGDGFTGERLGFGGRGPVRAHGCRG
jgi:hypothetical protein